MKIQRIIFFFCCSALSMGYALDPATVKYYELGKEKDRLQSLQLEKDRTLKILQKMMPKPPAVVLDVGGAAGVYSFPLAEAGYEVHLSDPVPLHIEQAEEQIGQLASCTVGDARKIEQPDNSADVVLFFGPLYHLDDPFDRMQALQEAYRVLKPGGKIFAVGISRFSSLMNYIYLGRIASRSEKIEQDLFTGVHDYHGSSSGFTAYLHLPEELREEVVQAGFSDVTIRAVEGPIWDKDRMAVLQKNPAEWEELLSLLEKIEMEESIIGASAHIMAIGEKRI